VTFDFSNGGAMTVHNNVAEPWKVTIVDTGLNTMTGGRVKRIQPYIGDETFMLTYGDGVCDINIRELLEFHRKHGKIATMTAINVGQRFGVLEIDKNGKVDKFREKNDGDGAVINGGYMVMNPEIFDYLEGDDTVLEKTPMETIADQGELMAYNHHGFWKCMDTQRDKMQLEALIASKEAPWMKWEREN
jgi:glucose-1-phosphate cytidylyltransferase